MRGAVGMRAEEGITGHRQLGVTSTTTFCVRPSYYFSKQQPRGIIYQHDNHIQRESGTLTKAVVCAIQSTG